jgi:hypothetical protein
MGGPGFLFLKGGLESFIVFLFGKTKTNPQEVLR